MSLDHARVSRFQSILAEAGIDAYFACNPISMGYLTGFFEDPLTGGVIALAAAALAWKRLPEAA